ncbi:MAG: DNA polymerase III subunit gamma/tau [Thermoleophilia bacterium]
MSISLYRKYRPTRFEEVVGQGHVTRTLVNAIHQDRVSHAYLFAGPRGTGKTSTAKILAMALNCEAGHGAATTEPDGDCPSCVSIRRGSSLDVLEIDAASNRGIDEIRDIRDRVSFAPVEGRMKVYIVDEVHMLTPEAFNALLKMLEEPPAHVVFVLATTEPHKVLATILSRCQRFDFRRPSAQEIAGVLAQVAGREGITVAESALSVIARAAAGSFRDAIGTLDQLSAYCDGAIGLQDTLALLGVAEQDLLFELVDVVDEHDTTAALLFVERLAQTGADLNQFLKDLLGHLRDLYVVRHTVEPPDSIITSEEHLGYLRGQANRISTTGLLAFIDLIGDVQKAVRQGADPRLELELALIKLTRPETDATLRGVLQRLDHLESGSPGEPRAPVVREASGAIPAHRRDDRPTPTAPATPARSDDPAVPAPRDGVGDDNGSGGAESEHRLKPATPAIGRIEPNIENLKRAWHIVLEAVNKHRPSLHAVLSEGRPDTLEDDVLTIKYPRGTDFAAAQAAKADNAAFLSDALLQATGRRLKVTTRVAGDDTDAAGDEEKSAADLTGADLLEALKREFGAFPVDDETTP